MSVYPPRGSRIGSPLLIATTGFAALALVGCAAEPQYPIDAFAPQGRGGFRQQAPTYAARQSDAPPASSQAPAAAPAPTATVDETPVARSGAMGAVEQTSLPPLSGPSAPIPYGRLARQSAPRQSAPRPSAPRGIARPVQADTAPVAEPPPAPPRHGPPTLSYAVVKGDTLYGLGRRFATPPAKLADDNNLSLKDHLSLGQKLKLPTGVKDGGEQSGASGEVTRTPGKLLPPLPSRRRGAPVTTAVAPSATPEPDVQPTPEPTPPRKAYTRARKTEADAAAAVADASARAPIAATPPVAVAAPPSSTSTVSTSQAAQAGRGRFIRPVTGDVISGFGDKGPGQRNDGVDLAAREGEGVRAAASGMVVYAGHDVPALGNLVAVKHADGWVTVYGNLEKITVKPRDQVSQGAQVGIAGQTPVTPRAQVHFEVRYSPDPAERARPIDPTLVLPHAG